MPLLGKAAYDIAGVRLDTLRTAFDTWRDVTLSADLPPEDAPAA